jgi:hypothetical protein
MDRLTVLFALHRERLPFWKSFPVRRSLRTPVPAWLCYWQEGGNVQVVHGGWGPASMERTLAWLLPNGPVGVILAGFSGGLVPDLAVGDLVLASEVRTPTGSVYPVTLPLTTTARTGPILSTEHILYDKSEKVALHTSTGALAVDLESATAARLCARAGVPFGCLRVISDDANGDLPPELEKVTDGERVRLWPLLKALCWRPGLLGDLLGLARATRLAARELARGLSEAIRSLRRE